MARHVLCACSAKAGGEDKRQREVCAPPLSIMSHDGGPGRLDEDTHRPVRGTPFSAASIVGIENGPSPLARSSALKDSISLTAP